MFPSGRYTRFSGKLVPAAMLGSWLCGTGLLVADEPPQESPPAATTEAPDATEIRHLVEQLGSEDYHARESASAALVEFGPAVVPYLEEAAQSPVLEVHTRAERLLAVVSRQSFEQQLQAFVTDVEGRRGTTLPGWERARRRLGESETARRLFAEMYRAEPALFAAYGDDTLQAQSELSVRIDELHDQQSQQNRMNFRARNQVQQATTANVMALLFVGADPELEVSQQLISRFRTMFEQTWPAPRVNAAAEREYLREWLAGWIIHQFSKPQREYEGIMLGMQYDIPEVLDLAVQVLRRGGGHQYSRMYAALCVGKYGQDWQLPLLESLLNDEAGVQPAQRHVNNRIVQYERRLRDIALAVLLHRTGQDPKAYGITDVNGGVEYEDLFRSVAFEDDEARNRAFAQWNEWRKRNALFDGEPPQPFATTELPTDSGAAVVPE